MVHGEEESVPFREVSSFQGRPYRGVPLYKHHNHNVKWENGHVGTSHFVLCGEVVLFEYITK